MGKSIKAPEPYELEKLLDMNIKANRFDASNPFGTQTWNELPDGRWSVDQQINPALMQAFENQVGYANQPAKQLNMMEHMQPMFDVMGTGLLQRSGLGGELPPMGSKAPMVTNQPLPVVPGSTRATKDPTKPDPSRPVGGVGGNADPGADPNQGRGNTPVGNGREGPSIGPGAQPGSTMTGTTGGPGTFRDGFGAAWDRWRGNGYPDEDYWKQVNKQKGAN